MGGFVDRKPAKGAQLDDLGQVRIERFQSKQRRSPRSAVTLRVEEIAALFKMCRWSVYARRDGSNVPF